MKLDILNITAGGMSGGQIKYLFHLLPGLISNPLIDSIVCTLPKKFTFDGLLPKHHKIRFVRVNPYSIINIKLGKELNSILDEFAPDVVYIPVERFFLYKKAPVVMMLRNMEPFIHPYAGNPLFVKIKNWLRFKNASQALRKADRIIAISEFVKDYLINQLHIDSEKIGLVYHGGGERIIQSQKPSCIPEALGKFIFSAGSIRPARGLEDLFEAFRYLAHQNVKVPLVVAGTADRLMRHYHRALKHWLNKNNLSANVIWAGNLNESEMSWCYQNCSVFVMTSRVESFGFIALEAMFNGCICISANNPCLPEIFGDSALYYAPKDAGKLTEQIRTVLAMTQIERSKMSSQAKATSSKFTWDVCTKKTVEELMLAKEFFDNRI